MGTSKREANPVSLNTLSRQSTCSAKEEAPSTVNQLASERRFDQAQKMAEVVPWKMPGRCVPSEQLTKLLTVRGGHGGFSDLCREAFVILSGAHRLPDMRDGVMLLEFGSRLAVFPSSDIWRCLVVRLPFWVVSQTKTNRKLQTSGGCLVLRVPLLGLPCCLEGTPRGSHPFWIPRFY